MKINLLLIFFVVVNLQAQEKLKDTFFFKLDNSYIYESKSIANKFLLKDKNSDEEFYLKGVGTLNNLKPKKILCLKGFIRTPKYYNKSQKQKLNNSELVNFFSSIKVYLVKKKDTENEYIEVNPILVFYD